MPETIPHVGLLIVVRSDPVVETLGSLRYGGYGLRLRINMLLRMIKTT